MTDHALKPSTAPFRDGEGGAATVWVMAAAEVDAWKAAADPMGIDAAGVTDVAWDCVLGRSLGLEATAPGRQTAEAWLAWARDRFGARPHAAFSGVEAR